MHYLKKNKKTLLTALAIVFSTFLLYWCLRQVDWYSFLTHLRQVNSAYLWLAALSTLGVIVIKTAQIRTLLPRTSTVPFFRLFQTVSTLLMMVNIIPFGGGHAIFVYLLGQREKVGKTVALSVLTLDQVLDGFGKLAVFLLVTWVVPLPNWMQQGVRSFILLFLGGYLAIFILAYGFRNYHFKEPKASLALARIYHLFKTWAHHLRPIHDIRKVFWVVICSISVRVFEALAIVMVEKSFGLSLPFYSSILVVAAISLATVFPFSPGRLGVFEVAVFATYQYLGVSTTLAMALALFVHFMHSVPLFLMGYAMSLKAGLRDQTIQLESEAPSI